MTYLCYFEDVPKIRSETSEVLYRYYLVTLS